MRISFPLPPGSETSLEQAAVPCGVRPGAVAAAAPVGALGDPHLLERRPAVGPALAQQERRGVGAHEAAVHLQAAPVRVAGVAPAALAVVDSQTAPTE